MQKLRVGILGATGMVGQRLVTLLNEHPYFEIAVLAASPRSHGKTYVEALNGRWAMPRAIPESMRNIRVLDAGSIGEIAGQVDFLFSAVDLPSEATRAMEEAYARHERPVVSCNSAGRSLPDVPMLIPEINPEHLSVLATQKKRLGTHRGFVVVKPNCSIQSYVPALTPLLPFGVARVVVSTYQAVSGAGRVLSSWQEMQGNVIPFIAREEEKSEQEPLKIWGSVHDGIICNAEIPCISATCVRVPVQDGHLATVSVGFLEKPTREAVLTAWANYQGQSTQGLPSAPDPFLRYIEENDRPQPRLDAMAGQGMAITIGRLREDPWLDWRFVCLSHNTLRGAAGGAVLIAELLQREGYLDKR